ncbi:hypothetical protein AMJ57_01160 [Parcubacteria bacterium SG8_24]|nr:MAG: hypothetical protein AMJ57_01160 [Parcubacteria bacterium SG8_24]
MLNGAPVSPLRKASDGSWCRYNFRGEVEGVACVGVILVKRWSDQVVVLIGRWPPEADEKRLKDFETISGSLALLPER